MRHLLKISLAILLAVSFALSDYYDSKMKQWNQPNGVKFTARLWGDEFAHQMETAEGYVIVQGDDGYFYFAILDAEGEYTASTFKVAIDKALSQSRNLKRSYARLAKIQEEIERVNKTRKDRRKSILGNNLNGNNFQLEGLSKIQTAGIDTCRLAVVLIDFTPKARDSLYDQPNGFHKHFFDSSFFSVGYWIADSNNNKHPNGEAIFGSFRDYYCDQSYGKLDIVGSGASKRSIINPLKSGSTTLPQWVLINHSKAYFGTSKTILMDTAIANAEAQIAGS